MYNLHRVRYKQTSGWWDEILEECNKTMRSDQIKIENDRDMVEAKIIEDNLETNRLRLSGDINSLFNGTGISLDYTASNEKMISEKWIVKTLEGNGYGLIWVLVLQVPGWTEEDHEKPMLW